MLWIYGKNDNYFGPHLSKQMFQAWQAAGGNTEYHLLPAFKQEGHLLVDYPQAVAVWAPLVPVLLGRAPLTAVRTFVSVCDVQPTAASALVRDENNGTTSIRCRLQSFASLPIQGNDDLMAQLGNRSCSCPPEAPPAGPAVALRGSHGHRFQIPLSGRPHIFITAVAHVVSWVSRSVLWLFRHPTADHEHGEYCHVSDGFSHSEHAGTRLRGQSSPT
jgi:hypothetical protein